MKKSLIAVLVSSIFISAPITSYSLDLSLDDVPGLGKDKKEGGGDLDPKALADQQSAVVQSLNESLRNLTKSQVQFAKAIGLDEQAAVAEKTSESLAKGDLTGKDDIKKAVKSTTSVQNELNKKMAEGVKLDAEAKANFAKGIPNYIKGSLAMIATGKNAKEAGESISKTKDLTVLTKLGTLIYVGTEAPSLISLFAGSTSTLSKFMTSNEIDTSELDKAAESMGD